MKNCIKINIVALILLFAGALSSQCFDDGHSAFKNQGWLSCSTSIGPIPERGDRHWVMYDFGEVYAIDSIQYWNHNAWGETGMGAKEILIDYSKDQNDWTTVGPISLDKAPGSWKYTGTKGPSLLHANMRYVLVTVISTWDESASCAGIAEFKFNIGENVDTEDLAIDGDWSLGPNPASESLNIMMPDYSDVQGVSIYNSVGQLVRSVNLPRANQTIISVSDLLSGIYFVTVYREDGVSTRSFVKG